MSRITLSGNASGTGNFTLASPNSNTDRTLTLPDATGTVNVSGLANEVPAGSAGAPAIYPTGDSNTGIFFPAADTIAFSEGGAESMRIDASGNLGLGVAPTNNGLGKTLQVGQAGAWVAESGSNRWWLANNWYLDGFDKYINNGFATIYSQQSGDHIWYIAPSGTAGNAATFTQAMTLNSSGNLLVGTTSAIGLVSVNYNHDTNIGLGIQSSSSAASTQVRFRNPNGAVGSITTSSTSTAYNTSSDYRLKENVQPMSGASERLMDLKPVNFAWKVDGSRVDGFLAHEAQAVVPEAVVGEKDQVQIIEIKDEDGNVTGTEEQPVYQGIDQSKLVPLLTAALQEALTEIASMKARITALEAN